MQRPIHETLCRMRNPLSAALRLAVLFAATLPFPAAAAPPAAPSFPAPGVTLEIPAPQQALPYAPPLPGMQVANWRIETDVHEPVTLPDHQLFIGPWLLRLDYSYPGRPPLTARQVIDTYRKSLALAGWQLVPVAGVPMGAVARYAQGGRCIVLKLHSEPKALHLTVWEPAASVQPAALRDALEKTGQATLYGITFAVNRSHLNIAMSEPILRQILNFLKENPSLKIEIQVHSDDSFRNVYARRPSQDRADEIKRWLIVHDIAAARLTSRGYGETKPLAPNQTPEGRARNRRVELVKLP